MTSGKSSESEQRPPDEVGPLLRAARQAAGLSQMAAVAATSLSQPALSRIERGASMPTLDLDRGVDQAAELAALYGMSEEDTAALAATVTDYHESARDERFVVSRAQNILSVQRRIRVREETTTYLRSWSTGLVFGPCQTPAYAAAIFGAPEDDPRVQERLRRGVDQPGNRHRQYDLVLPEMALAWTIGSTAVMADQCDRLVDVSRQSNVDLRILAARTDTGMAPPPAFHIHDGGGPVVLTQIYGQAQLDGREHVQRFADRFERLQGLAHAGDDARDLLVEIRDRFRGSA